MIKEIVFIAIVGMLCLIIGTLIGIKITFDCLYDSKKKKPPLNIHCFDCEIEMPVKEKNGRFYCSNCGLPH